MGADEQPVVRGVAFVQDAAAFAGPAEEILPYAVSGSLTLAMRLGRALDDEHGNVVYPGHPDLPEVPRGALDDEWLPVVGEKGLVVITRDKRIRYREAEKRAWIEHGVRGFVLTGKKSQTTADSQAILDQHWSRIESFVSTAPDGPWMYALTKSGLREIDLA